jgi:hypothetical protein
MWNELMTIDVREFDKINLKSLLFHIIFVFNHSRKINDLEKLPERWETRKSLIHSVSFLEEISIKRIQSSKEKLSFILTNNSSGIKK